MCSINQSINRILLENEIMNLIEVKIHLDMNYNNKSPDLILPLLLLLLILSPAPSLQSGCLEVSDSGVLYFSCMIQCGQN